MEEQGISKSEMARRMHTNRSALDRLLDPDNPSVTLLAHSACACTSSWLPDERTERGQSPLAPLCATALGDTVTNAQQRAYQLDDRMHWGGAHLRCNIGWRAAEWNRKRTRNEKPGT